MPFDLASIPETHDEPAHRGLFDAVAADLGLAAVVQALAPLLGPLDAELKAVVDRAKHSLTSLHRALAS